MKTKPKAPMTELRQLLFTAHEKACDRRNASTDTLLMAWQANGGDLIKCINAASCMLGGLHAPVKEVYDWLKLNDIIDFSSLYEAISQNKKTQGKWPGFGSSFFKSERDPLLDDLHEYIHMNHNEYSQLSHEITKFIMWKKEVKVYPNLGFYTGLVGYLEGVPRDFCEQLVLLPRIPKWIQMLEAEYGNQT